MSNEYINSSFIDEAILFAVKAHKNQKRNGKNFPYIIHPLEALAIAATMTDDHDLLVASVLHDVIEDTTVTYNELCEKFGVRVADAVRFESDEFFPDKTDKETWLVRKRIGLDRIKKASREWQIVALSDKLSNMRAIYQDYLEQGDAIWNKFHIKVYEAHKWRYQELVKAFDKLTDTIAFQEFAYLVAQVFNH